MPIRPRASTPALAALLAVAQAAGAADVAFAVRADPEALVVEASARLRADPGLAWEVLADYDHYPAFVPGVHASRTLYRRGRRVGVEQSWDAVPGILPWPVTVVYEIVESPPWYLSSVAATPVAGTLESRYAIAPGPEGTCLAYTGRLAPGDGAMRAAAEALVRKAIARQFQALADEIEAVALRRGAAGGSPR